MLLIQSVVEEPSYQIKSPMRIGLLIAAAQAGPDPDLTDVNYLQWTILQTYFPSVDDGMKADDNLRQGS